MVAVISGATRGVGKALANYFAKQGYDLALGARTENDLAVSTFISISRFVKIFCADS